MIIDTPNYDRPPTLTAPASIWPTALKWGVITGVVGSVITLVAYNTGMMDFGDDGRPPSSWIITVISLVLYVVFVYLGMMAYRDQGNGGYLTFRRAILWALGYGLALALVTGLFTLLFYYVLAPDFLPKMVEAQMAMMEEQGMSEEQVEAAESLLEMTMNPWVMTLSSMVGAVVIPVLIGLGVGAFLKTPPRY